MATVTSACRSCSAVAVEIKRQVEAHQLELCVYNTYFGVNEPGAIEAMIDICSRTGVKYFRATLPLAGVAAVRNLGIDRAVVPSYRDAMAPAELLRTVRLTLQHLARRTKLAGVCALLEIHWGTVMSSFTSAHALVRDLDPEAIAITFDPANMVIEGKEDWEYGLDLLRDYVANVHIKNASWVRKEGHWTWQWDGLQQGWWSGRSCSDCWLRAATAACSQWKISSCRARTKRRWNI